MGSIPHKNLKLMSFFPRGEEKKDRNETLLKNNSSIKFPKFGKNCKLAVLEVSEFQSRFMQRKPHKYI